MRHVGKRCAGMSRDMASGSTPKPGGPNNALTYAGPAGADAREGARLALHHRANGDEAELRLMVDILGLYVESRDIAAGYSRVPCIVDRKVRTKHSTAPKPKNPYRRPGKM